jgi:RimJ/RimL family protein N-acetyltransferase
MIPFVDVENLSLLRGQYIYLQFLREAHREALRPLAKDERIWEFTKTLLITETYDQQFDDYFNQALAFESRGDMAFVIMATDGDRLIGMTRAYDIDRRVKKITIGHTWYDPAVWGLAHNKECKLLLLRYIFKVMRFERAEFRVAGQNVRSQRAVEKIGGVREGVLRRHSLRNDGTPADTVYFSILSEEWGEKEKRLQLLVKQAGL